MCRNAQFTACILENDVTGSSNAQSDSRAGEPDRYGSKDKGHRFIRRLHEMKQKEAAKNADDSTGKSLGMFDVPYLESHECLMLFFRTQPLPLL
jgi:hypothetical protein